MLTKNDLNTLNAQFQLNEHEILRDMVYITEEAITRRLDAVDPSWQFERLEVWTSGDQVCASARLTVCGVSRDGIGMQKAGIGEPEKGAITDALKRCARLFGVGRYILDMGKIQNMQALEKWLNGGKSAPTPPAPKNPFNGQPASQPPPDANLAPSGAIAGQLPMWMASPVGEVWADLKTYLITSGIYPHENAMKNSFTKRGIVVSGKIAPDWKMKPASQLVTFIKTRHDEPLAEAS